MTLDDIKNIQTDQIDAYCLKLKPDLINLLELGNPKFTDK